MINRRAVLTASSRLSRSMILPQPQLSVLSTLSTLTTTSAQDDSSTLAFQRVTTQAASSGPSSISYSFQSNNENGYEASSQLPGASVQVVAEAESETSIEDDMNDVGATAQTPLVDDDCIAATENGEDTSETEDIAESTMGVDATLQAYSDPPTLPLDPGVSEQQQDDVPVETTGPPDSSIPLHKPEAVSRNAELQMALSAHDTKEALYLFRVSRREKVQLDPNILLDLLFYLCNETHLTLEASKVLLELKQSSSPVPIGVYKAICHGVRKLCYGCGPKKIVHKFMDDLTTDLSKLDHKDQQEILPILISSLMQQEYFDTRQHVIPIYNHMVQHDYPMHPKWLGHLLKFCGPDRFVGLPFHDMLKRAVDAGGRPWGRSIIRVIQSYFPYDNTEATKVALRALRQMLSRADENEATRERRIQDCKLDMSILEYIVAAGARRGDYELNLVVWDLMALFGYAPSEAIYECAIVSFARDHDLRRSAFDVLADMEANGFTASVPLIRSLGFSIGQEVAWVDETRDMILSDRSPPEWISVSSLNVFVSAYASLSRSNQAFSMLKEFTTRNIEPNQDTCAFLLESLWKDLARKQKYKHPRVDAYTYINRAYTVLEMIDQQEKLPSPTIVRHYVDLLCRLGEVETATRVVNEFRAHDGVVSDKTINRVTMANTRIGKYETARQIAMLGGEKLQFLLARVNNLEKKHRARQQKWKERQEHKRREQEIMDGPK